MTVVLLEELSRDHWLTTGDYARLLDRPHAEEARRLADRVRREQFGTRVFLRGLIDVGSICRFDCPHCLQRVSADCVRYRMRPREILDCCWAQNSRVICPMLRNTLTWTMPTARSSLSL